MNKIKKFFKRIWLFLLNTWKFKKELSEFQPYDYEYSIDMFIKSLKLTKDSMEKYSNETEQTLIPKLEQMDRLFEIHNILRGYKVKNLVEELGYSLYEDTYKFYEVYDKTEKSLINEFMDILTNEEYSNGKNIKSWWH